MSVCHHANPETAEIAPYESATATIVTVMMTTARYVEAGSTRSIVRNDELMFTIVHIRHFVRQTERSINLMNTRI
ncbi:hypothetical protein JCM18882A_14380 [Brevibacterium metallidurans]|uniref:Uncharacterized protein n=1 Tax=Brevibacterium metallidurans TaxID=1482676 RepID=A0ABN0SMK5_9MICO